MNLSHDDSRRNPSHDDRPRVSQSHDNCPPGLRRPGLNDERAGIKTVLKKLASVVLVVVAWFLIVFLLGYVSHAFVRLFMAGWGRA